jgi:hypothetical protein
MPITMFENEFARLKESHQEQISRLKQIYAEQLADIEGKVKIIATRQLTSTVTDDTYRLLLQKSDCKDIMVRALQSEIEEYRKSSRTTERGATIWKERYKILRTRTLEYFREIKKQQVDMKLGILRQFSTVNRDIDGMLEQVLERYLSIQTPRNARNLH